MDEILIMKRRIDKEIELWKDRLNFVRELDNPEFYFDSEYQSKLTDVKQLLVQGRKCPEKSWSGFVIVKPFRKSLVKLERIVRTMELLEGQVKPTVTMRAPVDRPTLAVGRA